MRLQSTGRPVHVVPVGESWGDRERGGEGKPGSAEERAHVLCMACCGIKRAAVSWWSIQYGGNGALQFIG